MSDSDIHFESIVFTNTVAPSISSKYGVWGFNHVSIIVKITTGQLDIKVSNDGSNFVTYESLTADGYSELNGFRYIQLVVSSGIVLSAALVARRRYSVLPMEIKVPKETYRYRRLDKIGWGRGDT